MHNHHEYGKYLVKVCKEYFEKYEKIYHKKKLKNAE